jgi:hypothetical protein
VGGDEALRVDTFRRLEHEDREAQRVPEEHEDVSLHMI